MPTPEECFAAFRKAAKEEGFSAEEADGLLNAFRAKMGEFGGDSVKASKAVADGLEKMAQFNKKQTAMTLLKEMELTGDIWDKFKNNFDRGMESGLVSHHGPQKGSLESVMSHQMGMHDTVSTGHAHDMQKTGFVKEYRSGDFDDLIIPYVRDLNDGMSPDAVKQKYISQSIISPANPDAIPVPFSEVAFEIAKVEHKWQKAVVQMGREVGIPIGHVAGWALSHNWDVNKMIPGIFTPIAGMKGEGFFDFNADKGLQEFITDFFRKDRDGNFYGDFKRTFDIDPSTPEGVAAIKEALTRTFDAMTLGVHLTANNAGSVGVLGPLTAHRVIHLGSGEAEAFMAKKYMNGNASERMGRHLKVATQKIAAFERMGPEPMKFLDNVTRNLQVRVRNAVTTGTMPRDMAKKNLDKFKKNRRRYVGMVRYLTGEADIPSNQIIAKVGSNIRFVNNISMLGAATLSSFADMGVAASGLEHHGDSFLGAYKRMADFLFESRNKPGIKELAVSLGVMGEAITGDVVSRFSVSETQTGRVARLQALNFKLNLLTPWTDHFRSAYTLGLSNLIGSQTDLSWNQLSPKLQRALSMYNFDADIWDLIRKHPEFDEQGRIFLTPKAVEKITDAEALGWLQKNRPRKDRRIKQPDGTLLLVPAYSKKDFIKFRRDLGFQMKGYYSHQVSIGVITPTIKTKRFLLQDTDPGSYTGLAMSLIAQFKSFGMGYLHGPGERAAFSRTEADESVYRAFREGRGDIIGLARSIVMLTAFGYIALSAKDIVRGREPRDPTEPRTWLAAMVQGGGLGLYGDFLFGGSNRYGNSPLIALLGPSASGIESSLKIMHRARTGEPFANELFRFIKGHTPFVNLFYLRAALDYMILNEFQEFMNPGYLKRMEKRVKRDQKQKFRLSPSKVHDLDFTEKAGAVLKSFIPGALPEELKGK